MATTTIHDVPDVILLNIFASISDTRTRNSLSLVSRKFMLLDRATRLSLTLRGNATDLYMIPTCFRSVTHLDLSFLSPWGHSLLSSSPLFDPLLLAHRLRVAFPAVASLTVYARSPSTIEVLVQQWPGLKRVKLVRWHQRLASWPIGQDFVCLFEQCRNLNWLDLSSFYYWTEDLPPVLRDFPEVSSSLVHLNLLTTSFAEGFKSQEIKEITAACPSLKNFSVACNFDPRYIGFVGDETLLAVATNCPKLTHLHLADTASLADVRGDLDNEGFTSEDAMITRATLVEFFCGLPLLQELVLDVGRNVRDASLALEMLNSKCKDLRVLKLGQFHGICLAIESQLDGIALCSGLQELSIKNCGDLTDMGLIEIGRGCCKLSTFEVQGCKRITEKGLRTMACLLRNTLVKVKISCCKNLDASASLRAVEPIRDRIQWLHIDCVWNGLDEIGNSEHSFQLDQVEMGSSSEYGEDMMSRKRCKYSYDSSDFHIMGNNGFWCKKWDKLQYLSLWIGVGELLTPLPTAGLVDCPSLEEIRIKVEGDCRGRHKPAESAFGLSSLAIYPRLSKMQLDCSETIGYALTAPSGQMDLSLWERFYLNGIGELRLSELDYWPPQDRDVNHRSLSLPAAGLLAGCLDLRKLFIHGTAHEHFMMFLLKIPNLRDVQLREDYYPAPENDMSTEMRAGSCSRFEAALNRRIILD
ncbi:PLEIOTROPIC PHOTOSIGNALING, ORESARA 9, MORE AXILLARY BRANCHES 2 [Hibiscus trionum]|uniref:PLEIOTROPIC PHOTOSIGNALING, ORESARA 9, MORE AXILLARY BRANCHES 2 n=1 Tax=Hibiscus trionum TaxID=183268 RepID=A0A9W7GYI5_HIBTR|nr:PLEIOTROPIC PHOTOSIGNALING, ORESARA 9, MORE AXILLARY BRANCHES 2 [Hibiscus trionum]